MEDFIFDIISSSGAKSVLSAVFGAAGLKAVEMWISYRARQEDNEQTEATNIRRELWEDRKTLLARVTAAEKDAVNWREKYYSALSQIMQLQTHIAITENSDEPNHENGNGHSLPPVPLSEILPPLSRFCLRCSGQAGDKTCPECGGTGLIRLVQTDPED